MNLGQVQAYIAANKPVVLGTAAAGVVGLALLQRKKAAGGGAAAAPASLRPAGTIPAAAVVPSQQMASTYDSSAYDVYNALTGQLGQLSEQIRQTSGSGINKAPEPIASTLFNPQGTGIYVKDPNGTIAEVESDGSLFGMTYAQWLPLSNGGAQIAAEIPAQSTIYTLAQNLTSKVK